jgi:hypothetical protein
LIEGSATFTTVSSRKTMNWATASAASASHFRFLSVVHAVI